jgi:hypothetical protein
MPTVIDQPKSDRARWFWADKKPWPSLVGAASDRTPSFSVCTFAVELGPHHGTQIRYSCSAGEARGLLFRCSLDAVAWRAVQADRLLIAKDAWVRVCLRLNLAHRAPANASGVPFDLSQGGVERGMWPATYVGHGMAIGIDRELMGGVLPDAPH